MPLARAWWLAGLCVVVGCGTSNDDRDAAPSSAAGAPSGGDDAGADPSAAGGPTVDVLTGPPVETSVFGPIEVLASDLEFPVDLALDAANVYFTLFGGSGGNAVLRLAKEGAAPEPVRPAGGPVVRDLEVGDSDVYWSDRDGLWSSSTGEPSSAELIIDWELARFAATATGFFFARNTAVGFQPLTGGEAQIFAEALPVGGNLFSGLLTASAGQGFTAFVDVSQPQLPAVLSSWTLDGGEKNELLRGFASLNAIASDGKHVYALSDDRAFRIPVTGGTVEVLAELDFTSRWIATDEDNLYVVDRGLSDGDCGSEQGSLWAVPKSGGQLTALARNLTCPYRVEADRTGVYWTVTPVVGAASAQTVPGAIVRLPR